MDDGRRRFEQRRALFEDALRDRFNRAIAEGYLPRDTSSHDLACFYAVLIQGLALQAQYSGTSKQFLRVVDVAMQCFPAAPMSRIRKPQKNSG
jgi:hypothetical protein